MSNVEVSKKNIGVNFNHNKEAEIVVWAPEVEKLEIKIFDEGEIIPLRKEDNGLWKLSTGEMKPGSLYKFRINGEKDYPDPASLSQPEGVHGPSQAIDINFYQWSNVGWNNIPLEEYIIYELHVGTFTPEGDFAAIEKKLDHLKDLGITAIELMPVAQFAGSRNWGYDGAYPFAVQNSYGGATGLQHFVNACHLKGLAVILDVVYNHLGPEGNYLPAYGPYITNKYKTPWGGAINFDEPWCDGVRNYVIENVLMWFRDFHIDALRLDAVHAIKDFSDKHILSEIKEYVGVYMQATGKKHYLIVESDLNDTKFIDPLKKGGFGMDAQWIDEFHHALRVTALGEQAGYYSDFTGIAHLEKAYKDAYVYDGQFSVHRKKNFGSKTVNAGKQFVVFSQNHDQVGNRMLGERSSTLVSFEMQKLMAAAVIVSPFIPLLFMGEEWSELNPFLYFVSHTDPKLAEAVRIGRKGEFAAFYAEGEAPDPMLEETFLQSKLQWNLNEEGLHKTMFQFYRSLINLRKSNPALFTLNRNQLHAESHQQKKLLLLHRWQDEQHVACLMNFSKEIQPSLPLPFESRWEKIFDSAEEKWNGVSNAPSTINVIKSEKKKIDLQPESIAIYSNYV